MPAVYGSPGGSSLPIFQTGAHADQIGVNDSPANALGYGHVVANGKANVYISQTSTNAYGLNIYNHQLATNRDYSGGDTVRSHRIACLVQTDVDNNDPSIPTVNDIYGWNYCSYLKVGLNGPSYGSCLGYVSLIDVVTEVNNNEYALYHGSLVAGTKDVPVIGGAHYWMTDLSIYGPVDAQPGILYGHSVQIANFYNGSPSKGSSVGCRITSSMDGAGSFWKRRTGNTTDGTRATCYPVDVGVGVGGATDGGTGDAFSNGVQIGGANLMDQTTITLAGDQGQVGRGVLVRAKNSGTSCARLGAFVSEGIGESGGLVFGLDTADVNRASLWRSANSVLSIHGQILPVSLVSAANDGAAATAGVPIGAFYQASGVVRVRLT